MDDSMAPEKERTHSDPIIQFRENLRKENMNCTNATNAEGNIRLSV
jgi:hypothetical protein